MEKKHHGKRKRIENPGRTVAMSYTKVYSGKLDTAERRGNGPQSFGKIESMYPAKDDIYARDKKEADISPEDPTKIKSPIEIINRINEKDFKDDVSAGDLDIPGSELDDEQENIGSEDEENNYYSIGGDRHHNLEEHQ